MDGAREPPIRILASVGRIALPLILDILSPSSALLISAPPEGFLRPNDAYLWETGLSAPSTFIDSTLSTPPEFGYLAQMVGILMNLWIEFQQGVLRAWIHDMLLRYTIPD